MPVLSVMDELPSFCIGDRVLVSNIQPGTLRFKGQTNFANGFWAGVELDNPEGSNNGTYDGVVYFECSEKHGIFESPVLGTSGQEELAKRLAELELSRELFDVLGDEQDWFDEDFGLSSRKQQQKQKPQQDGISGA
uniref:CAP-Gly domain-containing protein n=1 Tax=Cyprinus carpio TaxID=7962 RepID=A0A8C2CGK0_CYPCA